MNARLWLLAYLAAAVSVTLVHDVRLLALGLLAAAIGAGRDTPYLLRRALLAIALINGAVSLGYLLFAAAHGAVSWHYLLLLNLRVLLLAFLGAWFVRRVSLHHVGAAVPPLRFLITLAYGQIRVLARLLEDYRLAARSRCAGAQSLRVRYMQAAHQGGALLEKALHDAGEVTAAMRARGLFDD
ncbi:ABC transporter permease [Sulfurivermis fontis]|uniref:ABC transporter permease n=1 Tax=Sulfurivermis fontis TaxID=1972068 RepID=UPI000FD95AC9|nr:ABC transporter permease [Sulfurivermis fontis]